MSSQVLADTGFGSSRAQTGNRGPRVRIGARPASPAAVAAERRVRNVVAAAQSGLAAVSHPTLWLFGCGMGAFGAGCALVIAGVLPLWCGTLINTCVAYAMYTPLHEAVHGSVARGGPLRRALNDWVGRIAGLTALVAFDAFRLLHLHHHRYVNDPELDPDYWVPVTRPWLAPLSVFAGFYHNYVHTRRIAQRTGDRAGIRASRLRWWLVLGGFAIAAWSGYALQFLLLWIVPGILGLSIILLVFGWLPHRPFLGDGGPQDIRLGCLGQPWRRLWEVVSLGQSHHLFHHAFPKLPFYRLVGVYRSVAQDMQLAGRGVWNIDARERGPLDR